MKRKAISMVLAAAMLLTVVGCGSTDKPAASSEQKESAPAKQESTAGNAGEAEADPLAEKVSLHIVSRGVNEFTEENSVTHFLEEKFNVDLKWEVIPSANFNDAIANIIASGDYPDIMETNFGAKNTEELTAMYEDGVIAGLNDLIDQYGQDIMAARPEDTHWVMNEEGEKLGICCRFVDWPECMFMIRQDWLDNLGLEMPTTLDELDEVARAFTFDDPDGDGKDDTIGYAGTSQAILNSTPFAIGLGAYGETFGWELTEEGQYEPWEIRKGTKEALKWYRNAYMEGIAEPDFATQTADQYYERMNADRYGIQYYWTNNVGTSAWWTAFNEAVPHQNCVLLPAVTAEGYEDVSTHPFTNNPAPAFNGFNLLLFEKCENKDRAMMLLNYLATDEGRDLINFGVEGEAWDEVDGKVVMKGLTGDDYLKAGIGNHTLFFWRCVFDRVEDALRADSIETYPIQWVPAQTFPNYDGDTSSLDALAKSELVRMVIEPNVDVDKAFDEFRANWLKMGGQDYVDYMTENFKKYN